MPPSGPRRCSPGPLLERERLAGGGGRPCLLGRVVQQRGGGAKLGVGGGEAAAIVETAYRSGGGTSVYAECPLQRRLRDIHTLTQHFLVTRDTLTTAGAVLAGRDIDVPVFRAGGAGRGPS